MDCEVEQRGLPGLAIIGLGEERQLSEAPMIMFQDWQADPNSIFGEGDFRPRPQMDDWFCITQEPIAGRRKTRTSFANEKTEQSNLADAVKSVSTGDASASPVLLRPEDSQYGRLRPRSRLKMNSRCSALTAVLADLTDPKIRREGELRSNFPSEPNRAHIGCRGTSVSP
jgi:hypothetical protein